MKAGMSMPCMWSVTKELDSVMGADAKNELQKLDRPHQFNYPGIQLGGRPNRIQSTSRYLHEVRALKV